MITREDAIFDLVEGPITFTGEEIIFHDGQKHPTEFHKLQYICM